MMGKMLYNRNKHYKGSDNNGEPVLIPDSIHEDFQYDPETGKLYWKVITKQRKRNGGEAGTIKYRAGTKTPSKRAVTYKGKNIGVHRIIYKMHYGYCPDVLDHIDGNPLNNKIDNLRPADPALNHWNMKKFSSNMSGMTGVTWSKQSKKWRMRLTHKGVVHECFTDDKFEAACLRKSAELKMFGSFQRV